MVGWRSVGLFVALSWLAACAGSARSREPSTARPRKTAPVAQPVTPAEHPLARAVREQSAGQPAQKSGEQHDERAETQNRKVGVQGIHGTLSNFDVRLAMDKQGKQFGKCHATRARKVPALAGSVEFAIRVLPSGQVAAVHVQRSDLGDRALERCLSDVIQATRFPAPHGGEATVKWNMELAPTRRGKHVEQWDTERIERVLRKNRGELLETCDAARARAITVTAYVSKRGKVLAAGVAAPEPSSSEHFDCIADELRTWEMPKPRKGIAKVSFPLRG